MTSPLGISTSQGMWLTGKDMVGIGAGGRGELETISLGARELTDEMETLSPILSGDRRWIQEQIERGTRN